MRRADHLSRRVVPPVLRCRVRPINVYNEEAEVRAGQKRHRKNKYSKV